MQDLQVIEPNARVLVFGGTYSNLEATEAMFAEAARLSIPPERIICTGDVVAYGANAAETANLVRTSGCYVIMGNCEESLATGSADCGCGFPEDSACQRLSSAWFDYANRTIDQDLRSWMAALPRRIDVRFGQTQLAVVHGGVESINRFIFASTAASVKSDEISKAGVHGIIGGHCGIPFTQLIEGFLWHNSGAIGMPANDGTPRVWYSVLEEKDGSISIEHRALEYDHRLAAEKMRRAKLPEGYTAALSTGIWPSHDVLPLNEVRESGSPIEPGTVEWQPSLFSNPIRKVEAHSVDHMWPDQTRADGQRLPPEKFKNPLVTAAGHSRASVALDRLTTLWMNTGTLCNITCRNCYIESSPRNDRLSYIATSEVLAFLDEIKNSNLGTEEIGFTGGEPFMNPEIIPILEACLQRGFKVLVLTNGMKPMHRHKAELLGLLSQYSQLLTLRVSLDHYSAERHEEVRGADTFRQAISGLKWLSDHGFSISIAGRTMWGEDATTERDGYMRLLADEKIALGQDEPAALVLFPEMEASKDVPEITTDCWNILHKSPNDVMCSSSRMIVKRKGATKPVVVACTLLPYNSEFEFGHTLKEASGSVHLNHPYCAQFCVLGGSSCSGN